MGTNDNNSIGKALRYDSGKPRHDLIPGWSMNELAKIYEMGAKKYADNNWRKGMKWSRVIGSLKRHLNAIERGEDFDDESKLYHAAHVAWNAITLLEYYKIYPQGDDRHQLPSLKIGLDIDEVICNWVGDWTKYWKLDVPKTWFFQKDIQLKFEEMKNKGELDKFYLNLKPLISPDELPFEPHCYITSRPVSKEITEQWLIENNFPIRPVYSVGNGKSKVDVAKESGIDIFVDDRYENFKELNEAGICTFLMDSPHNQRYNVGYKRIKHLKDLM